MLSRPTIVVVYSALAVLVIVAMFSHARLADEATAVSSRKRELLARRIPVMQADGKPLEAILAELSATSGVPIDVDWDSVDPTGIRRTKRIYQLLFDVPLNVALDVLTAAVLKTRLAWRLDGDRVFISTPEKLMHDVVVRAYDIAAVQRRITAIVGDVPPQAVWSCFGNTPVTYVEATPLEDFITSNIAPDSWREAGGTVGVLQRAGDVMFVTHTEPRHAELAALLEKLLHSSDDDAWPLSDE